MQRTQYTHELGKGLKNARKENAMQLLGRSFPKVLMGSE